MVKAKMECVQTKLKHAALQKCLTLWSNEVGMYMQHGMPDTLVSVSILM